ncbi:AAA family ATPase [Haloplanus aerogenes]|uniref:AAA family ATPase n=1 Tax=Haloplanus aerogenes TaxID=660522 RepID=A0A3M0D8Z9_9EURY|nr:AAA family ATPase [Haloplanus aerogenes]AZH26397.1 AAA family ATPase [Haloplanus aerogenes]RMB18138.1 transitional endoplasmic reticulum ATPase [Haloplanus aerogenes]
MNERGGIELTVRSAEKRDAGRGIARLPEAARKRLGVLSGDAVTIEGERETVAKLWPARAGVPGDAIMIDAGTRADAGVAVGDTVRVRRASVADADSITLSAPEGIDADRESVRRELRRTIESRPLRDGDRVRVDSLGADPFVVVETRPEGAVRTTDGTEVRLVGGNGSGADRASASSGEPVDVSDEGSATTPPTLGGGEAAGRPATGVTYEDIGGLDDELDLVREMIELPLAEPELFVRLGVSPPKGVLLYGPPGTGKTLIAKAVANEVDATFISVSGPEIVSKYKGDSEERLRTVFERAREEAPTIVFFDEIDSVAPKREDGGGMEDRIVGQLLSLMDGLEARGEVIVIGATNRIDDLDPALRRGGRFDREIEIGVPGVAGRREILDVHTRRVPMTDDVNLDRLASHTHGFVGADLESLVTEAAMSALRRAKREGTQTADIQVTRDDFETAMASVDPSAMREYVSEAPTEGFESVGGLDEAKATLERAVTWPLTYGPLFEAADADPPSGVLLYGPPGTGKTLLARAIAAESEVNFVRVQGPELLDRYVGESEKAVREVFARARQTAPAIVFFDEIDAVATDRDRAGNEVTERVVSQLLTEFDAVADNPNLIVLAATNRKDALDPALLRAGRLESHVEVPAPDEPARRAILDVHTRAKPLTDDVDLDDLAARTAGYSGADLAAVCREAAMLAVRAVADAYPGPEANEHADEVSLTAAHFAAALESVSPSLD